MATTGAGRADGFTLLELLVALAVLALLLVGLTQGIRFGLLASNTERHLISSGDDFNIVDAVLRHIIEGADPGDAAGAARFAGSADRIECITTLPSAVAAAESRHIHAILLVDADHRLVVDWRPSVHALRIGTPERPFETELLQGVSRMEVAFWRPASGWVAAWREADLPRLVRVRLLFPEGDPRHRPDIIAAPMLDRP